MLDTTLCAIVCYYTIFVEHMTNFFMKDSTNELLSHVLSLSQKIHNASIRDIFHEEIIGIIKNTDKEDSDTYTYSDKLSDQKDIETADRILGMLRGVRKELYNSNRREDHTLAVRVRKTYQYLRRFR